MRAKIGLEVHVQLVTESKLFCSCSTKQEDKEPNSNTCPICLGFPGSKPKVNRKAIEYGIVVSKALNCEILPEIRFSRKSYFYPDMPKNFQITQYEVPLSREGFLLLNDKRIGIRRVHLEEDPARLMHVGGDITSAKYTLIDYNRSGVPLIEIVTEPDITSTREARTFLSKISVILDHIGVYDPSREGSLRVDANVSLIGGQRVEIKNITGFRNVEDALNYEIIRQRSLADMGVHVERETRHYDSESNTTHSLRKKEYEEEYGYIIEPDLVKIEVDSRWVEQLVEGMPELPDSRINRFTEHFGVPRFQSGIIVNTGRDLSEFFEECCRMYPKPEVLANWIVTYLLKSLNYEGITLKESKVDPKSFVELLELIDEGIVTERLAKELIKEYVNSGESPSSIVKQKNLGMMGTEELRESVRVVLAENQKAVADYMAGKTKAMDYLLGQVLRRILARGKPDDVKRLIREALNVEKIVPR